MDGIRFFPDRPEEYSVMISKKIGDGYDASVGLVGTPGVPVNRVHIITQTGASY